MVEAGCGSIAASALPWGLLPASELGEGTGWPGSSGRAVSHAAEPVPCVAVEGCTQAVCWAQPHSAPCVSAGDLPSTTVPPTTTTTTSRTPPRNVGTIWAGTVVSQALLGRLSSHQSRGEGKVPPVPALQHQKLPLEGEQTLNEL